MRKVIAICFLWLGILGAFIFYGYFICGDTDIRSQAYLNPQIAVVWGTENAVLWGGFGIGLATCVAVGLLIVGLVRGERLGRGGAVLFLAGLAVGSTAITANAMQLARNVVPFELFHGESGMNTAYMTIFMFLVACLASVVFSLWVFFGDRTNRNETQKGASPT